MTNLYCYVFLTATETIAIATAATITINCFDNLKVSTCSIQSINIIRGSTLIQSQFLTLHSESKEKAPILKRKLKEDRSRVFIRTRLLTQLCKDIAGCNGLMSISPTLSAKSAF